MDKSSWSGFRQCGRCGFISADCGLSNQEAEALYGPQYFKGNEYFDYAAEEESLRLNFCNRLAVLKQLVPDLDERSLLEIGCAHGFFLEEVADSVRCAAGIDVSAHAVQFAVEQSQVDAVAGDYLSFDFGRAFDVIAMWDTIEHLSHPDRVVAKIAHDLRPGGIIALTTGDIGSLNARLRGRKWRMIHPPTHLHYFSVRTLGRLLDRYGFDVVHVSHPGNARKLRSILYYLGGRSPEAFQALAGWKLFDFGITVNLFDIMYVVARRRSAS